MQVRLRTVLIKGTFAGCILATSVATAQLRVVDYNTAGVNNFSAMQTVIAAMANENVNGVVKPIDVFILQELGSGDVNSMLTILNGLGVGTYVSGNIGSSTGAGGVGLIYRDETVNLVAQQQILNTSSSGAARGVIRYQLRPEGYGSESDFFVYNSHYKASDSSADAARRNVEATAIRANADALGQGAHVIYAGDFNIYRSSEPMWATLTGPGNGQAFDPVNRVGSWHDSPAFRDVHTQNPAGSGGVGGGMDDRFDWQMVTAELMDNEGMSIIPGSYRAFGNNNTHTLNGHINTGTGASTGVLNALGNASDHLPVVVQYQVPAKMQVAVSAVPNQVIVGVPLQATVLVNNAAGDGVLVTSPIGADELDYTILASGAATGSVTGSDQAFGSVNSHDFTLNTSAAGLQTAVFSSSTTSPQVPSVPGPIDRSYAVLDHANASFLPGSDSSTLTIDFGEFLAGSGMQQEEFSLFNLMNTAGYTASLDLLGFAGSGDLDIFQTDLASFQKLAAGASFDFLSSFDTSAPGNFSATYSLLFSDDTSLPGALGGQILTLNLLGVVEEILSQYVLGDFDLDGNLTNADIQSMMDALVDLESYQSTNSLSETDLLQIGDLNADLVVSNADIQSLLDLLTSGESLSLIAVPEPSTGTLCLLALCLVQRIRNRRSVKKVQAIGNERLYLCRDQLCQS